LYVVKAKENSKELCGMQSRWIKNDISV
jgi:hypothetical protein